MPITCEHKIERINETEFHAVDYRIMKHIFSVHNKIGKLFKENTYKHQFIEICMENGIDDVKSEVPIHVKHESFTKTYYIDVLVESSVIYELKAVEALNDKHKMQLINYLFLTGTNHGKLINMGNSSVEHKYVSTGLTPEKRYSLVYDFDNWENISDDSAWFKKKIIELLKDWGGFLDINVFYEAICHFIGGKENVIKSVDIEITDNQKTNQPVYLLNPDTAFKITGLRKQKSNYRKHLQKFLDHTKLKVLQWINFNMHQIEFITLKNNHFVA
jgi:GxxExxY protein